MSLETRVAALAQAVGFDVKALYAAIAALGGGGGIPAVTVSVTFPAAGATVITQNVSVTGATIGQKVICSPVNDTDELEFDMLACAGIVTAINTIKLTVFSLGGLVTGQRNINITLG